MKRLSITFLLLFILCRPIFAQVPQGIPYQAVARNLQGQPMGNKAVKVRFSLLDSVLTGPTVYVETHALTTNLLGLFSATIGLGVPVTGSFSSINWGNNTKFLKVELDTTSSGTNYITLGTQQMMSVPYALYAASSGSLSSTTINVSLPAVTTGNTTNISSTAVTLNGTLVSSGNEVVLSKGFFLDTISPPSSNKLFPINPVDPSMGGFSVGISNLLPAKTYYFRAYATNTRGTGTGTIATFTTAAQQTVPAVTTDNTTNISFTSATVQGNVINGGGSNVYYRGIVYATSHNPTLSNGTAYGGSGTGIFTVALSGLQPNTLYYVRAFATNSFGTVYGNEVMLVTLNYSLPVVVTNTPSFLSASSVLSGGNITSDGGATITARGVCWDTLPAPTVTDSKTVDGTGTGLFSSTVTGLSNSATYYLRAYATSNAGTAYGDEKTILPNTVLNATPGLPIVGTGAISQRTATTAAGGGYISSDGGAPVTVRGVCWSLNPLPVLTDPHTTDSAGIGSFQSSLTNLAGCGNTYYVRAYATNSVGTAFGNVVTYLSGKPVLTTSPVTNLTSSSFTTGGDITYDGGCTITERGICWSLTPTPTTASWKITQGTGTGLFTVTKNSLPVNQTLYIRAYAINNAGTSYGNEITVTTPVGSALGIGQNYAGGIIFWLDSTGHHGMVCAPQIYHYYQWGCKQTDIPGTSTGLGSGASNTAAILAGCLESNTAARFCDDLVLNGYSDWYLPSLDELSMMNQNLWTFGIGNFGTQQVSSSSQYNNMSLFAYWFSNNALGSAPVISNKLSNYPVSPARNF